MYSRLNDRVTLTLVVGVMRVCPQFYVRHAHISHIGPSPDALPCTWLFARSLTLYLAGTL